MKRAEEIVIERIVELQRQRDGLLVVALDGQSGAGKTTIARQIAERIDAVHVLCDDFFVGGSNQFWAAKHTLDQIDNVIDWRRIRREVLEPLKAGTSASWHPFDWAAFEGVSSETIVAEPKPVILLDGAFSSRRELRDVVDLTVLIQASKDVRVRRIVQREGADYSQMWHATWQEAMDYYFSTLRPPESFDLVVNSDPLV